MTLQPGESIGKYVVRRKIAEGGMAEIYLCSSTGPEGFEKDVVIKRVRSHLATDASFIGMFIAEARLASRLNHPNIVQIFDFEKHEETYYLAMEYVRGQSLADARRLARTLMRPMTPTLVAHVGAEVARGLHYAHGLKDKGQPLGLVHRDVTPHNILLSFDGAVKLTDFGIAKANSSMTVPGVLKGKFAYMAPEQARGLRVDARTDLFALGITLWELLTGARLFDGDTDISVLNAVQDSIIAPPSRLNPDVPPELDAIIVKALQRDPALRFQSAQQMELGLAQFVLEHAKAIEDTDIGGYLRSLCPEEPTVAAMLEAPGPVPKLEATATPVSGSGRSAGSGRWTSGDSAAKSPVSGVADWPAHPDDEDVHAATHVANSEHLPRSPQPQKLAATPSPEPNGAALLPERVAPVLRQTVTDAPPRRARARAGKFLLPAAALVLFGAGGGFAFFFAAGPSRPPPPTAAPAASETLPAVQPLSPAVQINIDAGIDAGEPLEDAGSPEPETTASAVKEPSEANGTLVVYAVPYAEVWIDGKKTSLVEGVRTLPIASGRHVVELRHLTGGKRVVVDVQPNQRTTVRYMAPR